MQESITTTPNPPINTSFSKELPTLQLAWDSTSLGLLKSCPRLYQLSILEGYQGRQGSVHLAFGQHYHKALEAYDHEKSDGQSHQDAIRSAVRRALSDTWDTDANRPWQSDNPYKNRLNLVRSIVWYLDQFEEDAFKTVILSNGKPAVELSFRWQTDYRSLSTDEPFLYCGHIDRLVEWQDKTWVVDRKTTKSQIDQRFFDGFTPNNQFSGYCLSANMCYSTPVQGLIVDGAQIAVTFSRFQRGMVPRSKEQLQEWYDDLGFWLHQAEFYARQNYWPMQEGSCHNYGGCQFRGICSKSPVARKQWLQADFTKRIWDPLKARGDI